MRRKLLLLSLLALLCATVNAQMSQFEALYIYNIAKDIGWPESDANKDLTIVVIGDNSLYSDLAKLAQTRKVGSRTMVVSEAASINGLPAADIVFLGEAKSGLITNLVTLQQGKTTLIISGKAGQCTHGAGIAFVPENGKLQFQISDNNIRKNGLSASKRLITMGIAVD